MGKIIRILIAIIVVLSFVMLGRNTAAWAANPGADSSLNAQQPISPEGRRRCNNADKYKSRYCEDDDDGTVKPPRHRTRVCKLGTFSVGGVATIQIKKLGRGDCVTAFTTPYDPRPDPPLPPDSQALTDVLSLKLPRKDALVGLCFAVPPGSKNVSIYTISRGKWESVSTSIKKGTACTETTRSGTFILLRN
jgi:hypothetical protein